MTEGRVLTVDPFLSNGGHFAPDGHDDRTLCSEPPAPLVQLEHVVVVADRGPLVVTMQS